jgi:hypothetical protein
MVSDYLVFEKIFSPSKGALIRALVSLQLFFNKLRDSIKDNILECLVTTFVESIFYVKLMNTQTLIFKSLLIEPEPYMN